MSSSLIVLNLVLLATLLMVFPYVLNRIAIRGLAGAMANPHPDHAPLNDWAVRAKAAHDNAVENLVVFAPAMIVIELGGMTSTATTTAGLVYLGARVLHYVVYTLGIPVVRTLTFFLGWGATAYLIVKAGGFL